MLIFDHGTVLLYNIVVMLVTAGKDVDNANDSKFTKKIDVKHTVSYDKQ